MPDPRSRFEKLIDSDKRADVREENLSWSERREQTREEMQRQSSVDELYWQHKWGN
jgi:hypothetical protein